MSADNRKDSKVGQSAARLLTSLKRAQWLPHFDRSTLRDVVAEMGEIFKHLHFNLDLNRIGSGERTAAITFLDTALRRNRQCVLAYLNYRLEKLRDLVWDQVGRQEELPPPIKERLDQDEIKYVRQYDAVVNQYMLELNNGNSEFHLDLFTDNTPPVSVVTEVEVLSEFDGHALGTRFLSRRPTVEPYILQGKARHLHSGLSSH
jgi:hypothetical protein